jgi:hypothetical protein
VSVADANRFRELVARVDAFERGTPGLGSSLVPQGDTRVEALTEVVATLQRRIVALEKQQQETALFLTRKLGSNAAAR